MASISISSMHPIKKNSTSGRFFATYHRQIFLLPDSIMFYITKNPETPKFYQKIIQTCKYFFIKNPILVISYFNIIQSENKWCIYKNGYLVEIKNVTSQIWITYGLYFSIDNNYSGQANQISISSIIPKFYQKCDFKELCLSNLIISFNEFIFLAAGCPKISIYRTTVYNKNGSAALAVEEIIKILPRLKIFRYAFNNGHPVTSQTAHNLLKIPHFLELNYCDFNDIPEIFDIEYFFSYIKKNKKTKFWLVFDDQISDAYENRLQEIVDEILAPGNRDYKLPMIHFSGIAPSLLDAMEKHYYR